VHAHAHAHTHKHQLQQHNDIETAGGSGERGTYNLSDLTRFFICIPTLQVPLDSIFNLNIKGFISTYNVKYIVIHYTLSSWLLDLSFNKSLSIQTHQQGSSPATIL
jgi:hypothetical protein